MEPRRAGRWESHVRELVLPLKSRVTLDSHLASLGLSFLV